MEEIQLPAIVASHQALCPADSPLILMPEKKIVLEEFEFSVSGEPPAVLPRWFAGHAIAVPTTRVRTRTCDRIKKPRRIFGTCWIRSALPTKPLPRSIVTAWKKRLWPLLAAAAWLHLGKGTVMGMGQVEVVRGH
jgi:hypothetical protein